MRYLFANCGTKQKRQLTKNKSNYDCIYQQSQQQQKMAEQKNNIISKFHIINLIIRLAFKFLSYPIV